MDKLTDKQTGSIELESLQSYYRTSKKVIQEYIAEIERNNRYRSMRADVPKDCIMDDRSRLIDLYDACLGDAHLKSVIETLESQVFGERYMLARMNSKGRYVKDIEHTKKIQGTQFIKIIRGILEAKLFGYTLVQIGNLVDPYTGRLAEVKFVERRNVLPDQNIVLKRQGMILPRWDISEFPYSRNYILTNNDDLGLFAATTPIILAKKFTFANFINFAHTYGQPIIHGKTNDDNTASKQKLANDIASAAQQRVLVTGLEDTIEIKSMSLSNSERIYTSPIEMINAEVSNLILGSESMAGATQSYVGSTNAHQDVFRDRIEVYREYIENVINEQYIPRLVNMGFIPAGLEFKYSNRLEMNNKEKIELYNVLLDKYEIEPEEIEKEFGIVVGKQINTQVGGVGASGGAIAGARGNGPMNDEEYYKRYGRKRGESVANFLNREQHAG